MSVLYDRRQKWRRGGQCGMVWGKVAGGGVMWEGVGVSARVWGHVGGVEACQKGEEHIAGDGLETC